MKTLKKILFVFFIFLNLMILTSCKKDYQHIKNRVNHDTIFSVKEDVYYVFIYMNDCAVCERIKEDIYDYYKEAKKSSKKPNLYVLNRSEKENYDALTKSCSGDESYDYLIGVTKSSDIKVCSSPILLKIEYKKITKVFDTKSAILQELSEV